MSTPHPSTATVSPPAASALLCEAVSIPRAIPLTIDRKSTRLNSSHSQISYAVFCLKKKKNQTRANTTVRPQCAARSMRDNNQTTNTCKPSQDEQGSTELDVSDQMADGTPQIVSHYSVT